MSAEKNKALVRHFVDEVQSAGNIDALDELCSPEFVNHSAPPGVPSNCEGVKLVTAMFRQAFPDSYFTVEEMVAEGDKVATRKTFHGTHEGEFLGIPPDWPTGVDRPHRHCARGRWAGGGTLVNRR